MPSIYNWSTTPSDNANSDSDLTWAEGQAPSTVNNSARVMMARTRELVNDLGGGLSATGTANAIAISASSAFTTFANGRMFSFRAASSNTGATTINVNGIGVKPIWKVTAAGIVPLIGGEIIAGGIYFLQYSTASGGSWLIMNPTPPNLTPVGTINSFAGADAPAGWLLCGGQAVSRTTYPGLFDVIGTVFGAGNGTTTFNLPDLRGRVVGGKDNMGGSTAGRLTAGNGSVAGITLGATGGAEEVAITVAQMPSHNHGGATSQAGAHGHTFTYGNRNVAPGGGQASHMSDEGFNKAVTTVPNHGHNISSQGGGDAHNNVQPTIILNQIIKT